MNETVSEWVIERSRGEETAKQKRAVERERERNSKIDDLRESADE